MLEIDIRNSDKISQKLIFLKGDLDEDDIDELDEKVGVYLDDDIVSDIIVNIKGLHYMNSVAIGWFAGFSNKLKSKGKDIVFAQANKEIFDIIDIVGLSSVISVCNTNEEAFLYFEK